MLTVVDLIEKLKMTHFVWNRPTGLVMSNEVLETDLCTQNLTNRYNVWIPHAWD